MKVISIISAVAMTVFSTPLWANVTPLSPSQCQAMIGKGVMSTKAPVQCDRLRNVTFKHYTFDGKTATGKLVVLDAVAPHVERIFDELYQQGFPIAQAKPIEYYAGNDVKSMDANNTSAFNYRPIAGKSSLSLHAYGVAIDINPLQNPFVEFTSWGNSYYRTKCDG